MATSFCLCQFLLLLFASFTLGDKLVARRLNATLPTPAIGMAVYYDGQSDYIYLVSGTVGDFNYLESILRLDISTEGIEQIGSLPTGQGSWNTPHGTDSLGNLVYFSTSSSPFQIHKFDVVNNSVITVGDLSPGVPFTSATIQKSAGNVLVLGGGLFNYVLEYNLDSDTVQGEIVGNYPESIFGTAAVKIGNNTALVFSAAADVPYLELDLETLDKKSVAEGSFPPVEIGATVAYDNKNVYLFGGYVPDGPTVDQAIKLDPFTHSWEYVGIENDPPVPDHYYRHHTEVIWVEKLNRIYMFGGALLDDIGYLYIEDIYYIDLDLSSPPTSPPSTTTTEEPTTTTLNPQLFSCVDRTDGTHPHPSDCSKYISCRNGTLENVHPCPPPLLYDQTTGNCNLPSLVDCRLSCEDKEDGTYPHPHECNLFIICSNRDLFVFWCDSPLLFDPQELRCTLPDLVQCENS